MIKAFWEAHQDVPGDFARRLKNPPGEPRLMVYAFLSGLIGFFAGLPGIVAEGRAEIAATGAGDLSAHLLASLFGAVFLFPLFLYGFAALVRLICKVYGGQGTGQSTRHAVFWGMLLGSPFVAIGTLTSNSGIPLLTLTLNLVLFILFLWVLAGTVMVAEKFRSRLWVWAGFIAPSAFFFGTVLLSS